MNKLSFFDHFYQMIRKSKIIVLQNDKWYKAILNKYNKYSDFTSDLDKAFNLFIDEITVESQGTNSNFKTRIKARIKKLNSIKNQIESLNGTFESYEIINSIPSNDNYCTLAPIDLLLHQTFILKKIKDAIKFLKETIIDLQPINQKSHTKFPKIEPRINRYCDYFKNNDNPHDRIKYLEERKALFIEELRKEGFDYYESPYYGIIEYEISRLKDLVMNQAPHSKTQIHWAGNKRELFELIFALSKKQMFIDANHNCITRNILFHKIANFVNVDCPKNISSEIHKIISREVPNVFIQELNNTMIHEKNKFLRNP